MKFIVNKMAILGEAGFGDGRREIEATVCRVVADQRPVSCDLSKVIEALRRSGMPHLVASRGGRDHG